MTLQIRTQAITFLIFLITNTATFAQFDSLGINTKWRDGKILLNDGSQLEGYIRYNDKLGLIKFRNTLQEEDERSFTTQRILSMEFFDAAVSGYRKFAAFNVKNDETGWKGEMFFEILLECREFAVLTSRAQVNPAIRARSNYYGGVTYVKVGYEQFEQICLLEKDGDARVLLFTAEFEKDKFRTAAPLKPYFNKSLLIKHFGDRWAEVKSYVKKNKLQLRSKGDLLMVLEYFRALEKNDT